MNKTTKCRVVESDYPMCGMIESSSSYHPLQRAKQENTHINERSNVDMGVFIPNFLCLDWGFCLGV